MLEGARLVDRKFLFHYFARTIASTTILERTFKYYKAD